MLLVTGGGGFVMGHLVKRWLDRDPDARVLVVDRSPMHDSMSFHLGPERSRVEWVQCDIGDVSSAVQGAWRSQVRYVVHGAAVTSINRLLDSQGPGSPGLDAARPSMEANIDGTLATLALAARLPGLERMVNVSSGSVYGDTSPPGQALPEDECVDPSGLYAISKYASELFTRFGASELALPAVSVRLSGVFGELDRETPTRNVRCVPNAIARAAVVGTTLTLRARQAEGDFIHADDVGDAIISLLLADQLRYPVYNVAAGETATIATLLDYASELQPDLKVEVRTQGPVDVDYEAERNTGRWGAYSLDRISSDTGWRPSALRDSFQGYVRSVAARENQ